MRGHRRHLRAQSDCLTDHVRTAHGNRKHVPATCLCQCRASNCGADLRSGRAYQKWPTRNSKSPSCPMSREILVATTTSTLPEPPLHSFRRPMGNCRSKPTVDDTPLVATREVTSQEQSSPVLPQGAGAPGPSSRQSSTNQGRESPQVGGMSSHERLTYDRVQSAPQRVQYMDGSENVPRFPSVLRSRAKSSVASSDRGPSSYHRQMSAGERDHGRARVPLLTMIITLRSISQTTDHELSRP